MVGSIQHRHPILAPNPEIVFFVSVEKAAQPRRPAPSFVRSRWLRTSPLGTKSLGTLGGSINGGTPRRMVF